MESGSLTHTTYFQVSRGTWLHRMELCSWLWCGNHGMPVANHGKCRKGREFTWCVTLIGWEDRCCMDLDFTTSRCLYCCQIWYFSADYGERKIIKVNILTLNTWNFLVICPTKQSVCSFSFSMPLSGYFHATHSLREDINEKKTFSFGHCPNDGGGSTHARIFGPFFHHVFPYILTSISCYLILFGHF